MILQSVELTPNEEKATRKLFDTENIVLGHGHPNAPTAARQNAVLAMRHQLSLLDRIERRMSIEDWIDALLSETSLPQNTTEH